MKSSYETEIILCIVCYWLTQNNFLQYDLCILSTLINVISETSQITFIK